MVGVDRAFGERFLTSIDDYDAYGVHLLFNDWWEEAPREVIEKYVAAIESHPEQGPLAAEGWLAEPVDMDRLRACASGSLGEAYLHFIEDNGLEEQLAAGYRTLHEEMQQTGKLDGMPHVLQYKILRGYQTHDIHHVLTGYRPDPVGEISLQAFGFAQNNFPYAGMWIAVVTSHMTLLNPDLINPAMNAITDGWSFGKSAKNIQLVRFEDQLDRPLKDIQKEYGLYPRCVEHPGSQM